MRGLGGGERIGIAVRKGRAFYRHVRSAAVRSKTEAAEGTITEASVSGRAGGVCGPDDERIGLFDQAMAGIRAEKKKRRRVSVWFRKTRWKGLAGGTHAES